MYTEFDQDDYQTKQRHNLKNEHINVYTRLLSMLRLPNFAIFKGDVEIVKAAENTLGCCSKSFFSTRFRHQTFKGNEKVSTLLYDKCHSVVLFMFSGNPLLHRLQPHILDNLCPTRVSVFPATHLPQFIG